MARNSQAGKGYTTRNPNANFGRLIDYLPGMSGLTPQGGVPLVNFDCDRRFHRIMVQCTAVNYHGGTSLVATKITSTSGAGLLVDVTVNAFGVVTAIIPHAGNAGTGWVTGDTMTFADATGAGFVGTVTANAGAVTAIAITFTGTPTAIDPIRLIGPIQIAVNGSPIIDTTAAYEIRRALFNFEPITYGQLPIFFTEPWRNFTKWPEITSWDMAGQKTFSMKLTINPGFTSPNINGTYEYDYIRNTVIGEIDAPTYQAAIANGSAPPPMLHIIARHLFTPQLNGGATILPGGTPPITWPILRMHFDAGTPGTLTQAIIKADNQIYEQGFIGASSGGAQMDQLRERLIEYGYNTGIFDYSFVADIKQRIQDALKIGSEMKITIQSTIAEGLTILQERVQSRYE
ncbi:MAG: hypothetical protein ABSE90_07225 [Verrucomicrobiota bacterium]|jgi:hypothetical protein